MDQDEDGVLTQNETQKLVKRLVEMSGDSGLASNPGELTGRGVLEVVDPAQSDNIVFSDLLVFFLGFMVETGNGSVSLIQFLKQQRK